MTDELGYIYSCALNVNIQVKIGSLEGNLELLTKDDYTENPLSNFNMHSENECSDLYICAKLFSNGHDLAVPIKTSYKFFTTRWNWNEWLTLPLKFSELARDTILALTIYDIQLHRVKCIGGTSISLFGKYGAFRQGMYDLTVWPNVEGDGSLDHKTPGRILDTDNEMARITKLSKYHRNGHMAHIDWLDRLTFREVESINNRQKKKSNTLFLFIEFPRLLFDNKDVVVIYYEQDADLPIQPIQYGPLTPVYDPDLDSDNLHEDKHCKLARSLRAGPLERDIKPNADIRQRLNTLISYPQTAILTSEEKDLIWTFRFYLSTQKKALSKFLRSVQWKNEEEVRQALDLLTKWSPMDVEDALELLSSYFTHNIVRKYAVSRLVQADDEDLMMYLLQLVQALKYEDFNEIRQTYDLASPTSADATNPGNLVKNADVSESDVISIESSITSAMLRVETKIEEEANVIPSMLLDALNEDADYLEDNQQMDLASFLIYRASRNEKLANYFYWYLKVECTDGDDQKSRSAYVSEMYRTVMKRFNRVLLRGSKFHQRLKTNINEQETFLSKILHLIKAVQKESANRVKKIEKLKELLLGDKDHPSWFLHFEPIPLPLDPGVTICGIDPSSATIFKSALTPCRLTFVTTTPSVGYVSIFKYGDDLRQDQLVLQIISLMDKILRRENLDLKLTPYKVLATSNKHGFVQFIDSTSLAEVLATDGSILSFLRRVAPSENHALGIQHEVLDNYIKSCAGYCIVTYILGVGDRHFDNLLITNSGRLFHIDFGFILGRDPKPLPPPMKLTKEMVEAMGGIGSESFNDFRQHCYTAFLHLRRSANLILNLFSLMIDANIPDIALEPDKTVKKVEDKFQLELTDEQAVQFVQNLIDVSLSATVAAIIEHMHKITQYLRK